MALPSTNNRSFGMSDGVKAFNAVKVEVVYEANYSSVIAVNFPFNN
jgi:hypothetical protein